MPAGSSLEARLSSQRASLTGHAESGGREGQVLTVPNSMTRLAGPLLGGFLLPLLCALGIRVAKERRKLAERNPREPGRKAIGSKVEALLNSLADLDELFAAGKIVERKYRKERAESKAKLVAILKKNPPVFVESRVTRNLPVAPKQGDRPPVSSTCGPPREPITVNDIPAFAQIVTKNL